MSKENYNFAPLSFAAAEKYLQLLQQGRFVLAMVKPHRFKKYKKILAKLEGFNIHPIAGKEFKLDETCLKDLYGVHQNQPYFANILREYTKGKAYVFLMEVLPMVEDDAVEYARTVVGDTKNPYNWTIRGLFWDYKNHDPETNNVIHCAANWKENVQQVKCFYPLDVLAGLVGQV